MFAASILTSDNVAPAFLFTCFLLTVRSQAWNNMAGLSPGLQMRVTQKGFDYANDLAIDIISNQLKGKYIPNQSGSSHQSVGDIRYSLTNIRIISFEKPTSRISSDDNGLMWRTSKGGCSLAANWRYEYKKWFIKITDHGSMNVDVNGIDVYAAVKLGASHDGHPTIHCFSCTASVRSLHAKFHGGASWLYNLFSSAIGHSIKDQLNKLLSEAVVKAVNENADKSLQHFNVITKLGKTFELDYSLIENPTFSRTGYVQTYHKGEILWLSDPTPASLKPPKFALSAPTNKMVTLWMSDYTINTFAYQCYKHGILKYELSKRDLPAQYQNILNTTCDTGTCIGRFVPQLNKRYPHSTLNLNLTTSEQPMLSIAPQGIIGKWKGNMNFQVALKTGKFVDAFTLEIAAIFKIYNVRIGEKGKLFAKPEIDSHNERVIDSKIGTIQLAGLKFLIQIVLSDFVVPKLNEIGNSGLPIPKIDKYYAVNPEIKFGEHVLLLSIDVSDHQQRDLRFEPFAHRYSGIGHEWRKM